ncbi:MAG: ATP-binding protein [Acidobacteriota bacterium]|nr:ATP-binding protein [Acidobacteriota bacterium]
MSLGAKLPIGALGRLAAAGAAAYAGVQLTGDANFAAALATVASGYFVNRSTAVEEQFTATQLASKNHHLQLALAGSFRIALDNLQPRYPGFEALFESWQAILNAALDKSATLLPIIIPAEFGPLLEAANPYVDQPAAFEEAEFLLRFRLTYQQAFERTKTYPAIPPTVLMVLPPDLREHLKKELLPEFQKAFANLLTQKDSEYARRAFEHRHLQELVSRVRRLDAQLRLPVAPLRPPSPLDLTRELDILRAENRAIPVVGREPDLADLHTWATSPAPISVRILTGPAGSGKTRLAIQFLEELNGADWHAGFLREANLSGLTQRDWDRPTLAVVDYAAAAAQPLKLWLAHLADQSPTQLLRVLLLEREADPESGWLRYLLDRTSTGDRIASLLDPTSPSALRRSRT